ncbi:MAG: glutamine-hydrolyzing carbamoyl-phosphate synthase small subunit [Rhizobiaceae bacterium]
MTTNGWTENKPTAVLVLADGTVIEGYGAGSTGVKQAEVCFNTAITGYQEIMTDPSYAGQIVAFTFPHIGNVGANPEDIETLNMAAESRIAGAVFRAEITQPSNFRSMQHLDEWMKSWDIIAITGVDTRALTALIREKGLVNAVIAHDPTGDFDLKELKQLATQWAGLEGADLAKEVTSYDVSDWTQTPWVWNEGYSNSAAEDFHIVAIDYGVKQNILRLLAGLGAKVTVMPATATAEDVLAQNPDGVFLSNGPGDPAATGNAYAIETIRGLIDTGIPIFGICLGHQMLALALGAKTMKMHQGHHGANHPVKDFTTEKVEIVSMNHGFAVDNETLPEGVEQTHISLFDNSNCGLAVNGKPIFSVQHHPEASPGPQDSHYLFRRFANLIRARKNMELIPERVDPTNADA